MTDILQQDIMYLPGVGPARKKILQNEIQVLTYEDLLQYYPYKYIDRSRIHHISQLTPDMTIVQVKARILSFEEFKNGPRKKRIVAHITDGTAVADIVWFQNTVRYLYQNYKVGEEYIIFGKPTIYAGRIQFAHPEIEAIGEKQAGNRGMQPYYITTERMKKSGMTSRTLQKLIHTIILRVLQEQTIPETLPPNIIERIPLISRAKAYTLIHFPQDQEDVRQAKLRLKFEELFYIQLGIIRYAKTRQVAHKGYKLSRVGQHFKQFYYQKLDFELTSAQQRVMREIKNDLDRPQQMNRLLQGDVGSGKTIIALMTMLLAIDNDAQSCLMAPTEILAEQHYATISRYLADTPLQVGLLTGNVKGKNREHLLRETAMGRINILIGTHAVIEEQVVFQKLAVAIIDEQHRFGVKQRAKLWDKNDISPHILVMTATPIPRTLAMTIYGDLDVSVIDELPPGRKPIQTLHYKDNEMAPIYQGISQQIQQGRQVYVVYPLIQESEKIDLKNLEDGFNTLQEIFSQYRISKIHGKMKPAEKEEEMQKFISAQTQILVATTVIEVGVNVPNASVMIIMDAHRYGLSQLHQLRGRVGRGANKSYCLLVTSPKISEDTLQRIDIMCRTNDGFKIAEADLKFRGPGDLEGTQQSGMGLNLKIADIAHDGAIVGLARQYASMVIEQDPQRQLPTYAACWQRLQFLRKDDRDWAEIS